MTDKHIKTATSFRLSEDGRTLLLRLAEHLGLNRTSVLEMLIRKQAAREFGPSSRKEGRGGR